MWSRPGRLLPDNVGVTGYALYKDGSLLRNLGGSVLSYLDHNVQPGVRSYRVAAFDSSRNQSGQSAPATVTVPDTTPPSTPLNVVAVATLDSVTTTWTAAIDDVAVTGYRVYRDGLQIGTTTATVRTFTETLVPVGSHTYNVAALDAAGNVSPQSAAAIANIVSLLDTTAPTTPAGLQATAAGSSVTLVWTAATDNVGVTGYGVYRRTKGALAWTKIADAPAVTATTDVNVPAGTYEYSVDAVDAAANRSAQSVVATAAVANQPPVAPRSITAFPQRDFVSVAGYTAVEGPMVVSVLRGGALVSQSTPIMPDAQGLVEVNHVGGGCWLNVTPDIRPGDVVRVTNAAGVPDQTTVANVVGGRAVQIAADTVQISGTARDVNGTPLPVGQIEHRLIAGGVLVFQRPTSTPRRSGPGRHVVL